MLTNLMQMKWRTVIAGILIGLGMIGWSSAFTGADPPAEEQPNPPSSTPTASPTASPTPSPTATPTATSTLRPTATATPTPTLDPVIEITAGYKTQQVIIWLSEVERINEWQELDLDPYLVLAVMAAESGGDHYVISSAGACGLMQVIPKTWYELSASQICGSRVGNLYMGMYILRWSLNLAEKNGEPMEYGLAYYNCSYDNVQADMCGARGGLHYAEEVLTFWLPRVRQAIGDAQ